MSSNQLSLKENFPSSFFPKISVIIPAHNEEKYLEKTLRSLQQQTFLDYELLVICNGCTDKTEEVAQKFLKKKDNLFSLKEAKVSLARNFGAQQAKGELLVFLDADTSLNPDSLEIIANTFSSKESVATTKVKPDIPKLKYRLLLFLKNFFHQTNLYQGCSGVLICRKKDFHLVQGYPDLAVKEHRKLILKLKKLGKYKVIATEALTSMRRFEKWKLRKVLFFWIKQWFKDYLFDLKKATYEVVR